MGKVLDYKKVNRIRRNRGYSFEDGIVKKLKSMGWFAKRLGGSSVNLPDVLATKYDTIYSMEAKSGMDKKYLYIPQDQIQRCIEMLDGFKIFKHRYLVFSFKFSKKRSNNPTYYHFGFDMNNTFMRNQFAKMVNTGVRCEKTGIITFMRITPEQIPILVQWDMYGNSLPLELKPLLGSMNIYD